MRTQRQHRQEHTADKNLVAAKKELLYAAKHRKHERQLNYVRPPKEVPLYEKAKAAETTERDLTKAAYLYVDAAKNGEKVDSCIKDFASIAHQMGETKLAVSFLKEVRTFYEGDIIKFDRLLGTLEKQIEPSGKHLCKSILLELPS